VVPSPPHLKVLNTMLSLRAISQQNKEFNDVKERIIVEKRTRNRRKTEVNVFV